MLPMEEISPSDGLLDVFIIQAATLAAIREWFSLSRPNITPDDLEYITHYQGKHIKIRTENEMQVDTDGEVYLTTPLDIRIQPKQLMMLVPRPAAETLPE